MTCRHCDEPTTGYWWDVCLGCAGSPMNHSPRVVKYTGGPLWAVMREDWTTYSPDAAPDSDPDRYDAGPF